MADSGTTETPDPDVAISRSQQADREGFDRRVVQIKSSPGFVHGLEDVYGNEAVAVQIEQLAAVATDAEVDTLVSNMQGKRFKFESTPDGPRAVVVGEQEVEPASAMQQQGGPALKCYQAWVAAYLYAIGSGAICGAATLAQFIAGLGCAAFAWTAGQAVDWNRACG